MLISLMLTVVAVSVEPSRPRAFHLPPPTGERGCFSYPRLSGARWPDWSLEGGLYVGGSPLAPVPRAGFNGPPAAAYQMATSSGWTGTACVGLGGVQEPLVSALPGAEPSAGIRLHYSGGNSTGCGLRRAFEARLVCDPAGSASGSLSPVAIEGDCSPAYNGTYIFRWSTPLACPDYNASATCPPPSPGQPRPFVPAVPFYCGPSWRPGFITTAPTHDPYSPAVARQKAVRVQAASDMRWTVELGGTADMESTLTPSASCKNISFQPNVEVSLTNLGAAPVKNPRLASNGQRRWHNITSIAAEAYAGAGPGASQQERALAGWDFERQVRRSCSMQLRNHAPAPTFHMTALFSLWLWCTAQLHYHSMPLFGQEELHDPVKYFNMYGSGFCDDAGNSFCSLAFHGGLGDGAVTGKLPRNRALHGHVQGEVHFAGQYHFLDIDENMFYLDPENERVLGGDDIALDHDLGKREHTWQGPANADGPSPTQFSGCDRHACRTHLAPSPSL